MVYLMQFLYYALPLAAIVFFIVSLVRYRSARNQNSNYPGSVSQEELKKRRLLLIVASVIAGVFAAVIIGFIGLLFLAVAFM